MSHTPGQEGSLIRRPRVHAAFHAGHVEPTLARKSSPRLAETRARLARATTPHRISGRRLKVPKGIPGTEINGSSNVSAVF